MGIGLFKLFVDGMEKNMEGSFHIPRKVLTELIGNFMRVLLTAFS